MKHRVLCLSALLLCFLPATSTLAQGEGRVSLRGPDSTQIRSILRAMESEIRTEPTLQRQRISNPADAPTMRLSLGEADGQTFPVVAQLDESRSEGEDSVFAAPVAFRSVTPLVSVPAAARARLDALYYHDYRSAREKLRARGIPTEYMPRLLTEKESSEQIDMIGTWGAWSEPAGTMGFLSASLMDDPSDHGQDRSTTYLLGPDGTVVFHTVGGEYTLIAAADLDGDGSFELILREGIAYRKADGWIFPAAAKSTFCD